MLANDDFNVYSHICYVNLKSGRGCVSLAPALTVTLVYNSLSGSKSHVVLASRLFRSGLIISRLRSATCSSEP